jgi:hypothetical protein
MIECGAAKLTVSEFFAPQPSAQGTYALVSEKIGDDRGQMLLGQREQPTHQMC